MKTTYFFLSLVLTAVVPCECIAQSFLKDPVCLAETKQIQKRISELQNCDSLDDCIEIWLGCPFGCGTALNKSAQSEAKALVESYNSKCQPCAYRCANREHHLQCSDGRCVIEYGEWR